MTIEMGTSVEKLTDRIDVSEKKGTINDVVRQ